MNDHAQSKLLYLRWVSKNDTVELNEFCHQCGQPLDYNLPSGHKDEPIVSVSLDSYKHAKCVRSNTTTKWTKKHGRERNKSRR